MLTPLDYSLSEDGFVLTHEDRMVGIVRYVSGAEPYRAEMVVPSLAGLKERFRKFEPALNWVMVMWNDTLD